MADDYISQYAPTADNSGSASAGGSSDYVSQYAPSPDQSVPQALSQNQTPNDNDWWNNYWGDLSGHASNSYYNISQGRGTEMPAPDAPTVKKLIQDRQPFQQDIALASDPDADADTKARGALSARRLAQIDAVLGSMGGGTASGTATDPAAVLMATQHEQLMSSDRYRDVYHAAAPILGPVAASNYAKQRLAQEVTDSPYMRDSVFANLMGFDSSEAFNQAYDAEFNNHWYDPSNILRSAVPLGITPDVIAGAAREASRSARGLAPVAAMLNPASAMTPQDVRDEEMGHFIEGARGFEKSIPEPTTTEGKIEQGIGAFVPGLLTAGAGEPGATGEDILAGGGSLSEAEKALGKSAAINELGLATGGLGQNLNRAARMGIQTGAGGALYEGQRRIENAMSGEDQQRPFDPVEFAMQAGSAAAGAFGEHAPQFEAIAKTLGDNPEAMDRLRYIASNAQAKGTPWTNAELRSLQKTGDLRAQTQDHFGEWRDAMDAQQVEEPTPAETATPEAAATTQAAEDLVGSPTTPEDSSKVLYHASRADFNQFKGGMEGTQSDPGELGRGTYLAGDARLAPYFLGKDKNNGTLYTVEHSMDNPKVFDSPQEALDWQGEHGATSPEAADRIRQKYEDAGHDGVIVKNPDGTVQQAVVFDPDKLKITAKQPIGRPPKETSNATEQPDNAASVAARVAGEDTAAEGAVAGQENNAGADEQSGAPAGADAGGGSPIGDQSRDGEPVRSVKTPVGLVHIETDAGETRSGTNADGTPWSRKMNHPYGYIEGVPGADGGSMDVMLGPAHTNPFAKVFVIDQQKVSGDTAPAQGFDEHKVMLGFKNLRDAQRAYLSEYPRGWQGMGQVREMSTQEFKQWAKGQGREESQVGQVDPEVPRALLRQQQPDATAMHAVTEEPEASRADLSGHPLARGNLPNANGPIRNGRTNFVEASMAAPGGHETVLRNLYPMNQDPRGLFEVARQELESRGLPQDEPHLANEVERQIIIRGYDGIDYGDHTATTIGPDVPTRPREGAGQAQEAASVPREATTGQPIAEAPARAVEGVDDTRSGNGDRLGSLEGREPENDAVEQPAARGRGEPELPPQTERGAGREQGNPAVEGEAAGQGVRPPDGQGRSDAHQHGGVERTLRNEDTEAMLERKGIEKPEPTEPMKGEDVSARAKATLDKDPGAGERLAAEIVANPRTLTPEENHLLLHDQERLDREHGNHVDLANEATARGDEAAAAVHRLEADNLRDKLAVNGEAAMRAGTEWGRSGVARQLTQDGRYSLARMLAESKMAKGRELTPGEKLEVEAHQKQIAKAVKAVGDAAATAGRRPVAKSDQEKAQKNFSKLVDKFKSINKLDQMTKECAL